MTAQLETIREQKIARAREALQRARSLRATRRTIGVDGVCQHVEGVDGEWLENWPDEEDVQRDEEDWNYLYSDVLSQLDIATVLLVKAEFLRRSQHRTEGNVNGTDIIFRLFLTAIESGLAQPRDESVKGVASSPAWDEISRS